MRGKCLCGEVEFEILGAMPRLYQCHCTLCRKQGGSASNSATIVANENFRWLAGERNIASWVKDTGFRSDFCSKCGATLPNPLRTWPYYWVPAGLLDGDIGTEVVAHYYVGSKAAWDVIGAQGVRYDEVPDMAEFIAILHGGGRGGT
jgi:hypothetical protein